MKVKTIRENETTGKNKQSGSQEFFGGGLNKCLS